LLYKAQMEKPKAAILMSMTGMQKTMEMLSKGDVGGASYFMNQSYEGTYKALWEENIPVDVVRSDRGLSLDDIADYKILYLPFQIMLSPEAAKVLEQYVYQGGWLVADAKTALMDDRDFGYEINPGAGLDKVFGAFREDFVGQNGSFDIRFSENEILAKSNYKSYKGVFYKDYLTTYEGTQTIATFTDDNMPALTVNKYGKGYAILSAVPLGGSYLNGMEGPGKIITDLALKAEADFDVSCSTSSTQIIVKLHTIDDKVLAYLINTGDRDFAGNVSFQNILSEEMNSATDIISESEVKVDSNIESIKLNVELASHKTAVILIK
jgi:beta-galactosidase